MLLGQSILLKPFLEKAFNNEPPFENVEQTHDSPTLSAQSQELKRKLIATANGSQSDNIHWSASDAIAEIPAKRPRMTREIGGPERSETRLPTSDPLLPPHDVLKRLFELYASRIHPWIPVLHVRSFREQMADPSKQSKLASIYHAIVSVCARFSTDPYFTKRTDLKDLSTKCRHTVILQSMEVATVQNLQALVIVAFDIVSKLTLYVALGPFLVTNLHRVERLIP